MELLKYYKKKGIIDRVNFLVLSKCVETDNVDFADYLFENDLLLDRNIPFMLRSSIQQCFCADYRLPFLEKMYERYPKLSLNNKF